MRTLLKNARILKMTGEDIFFSSIVIENDRITYIGEAYDKYLFFRRILLLQNYML